MQHYPGPLPAKVCRSHLYSLDALRGIAALVVVLFHWRHFLYPDPSQHIYELQRMPFYPVLQFAYSNGGRAVPLFFALSGFVFYWLYAEDIVKRRITTWEFFVLRFSRLYPLHFATLVFILFAQAAFHHWQGAFFTYSHNGLKHFLLHLFFASNWLRPEFSFNGPAWSVSVEVLLYGVFFGVCMLRLTSWWKILLISLAGLHLKRLGMPQVGDGIFWFFLGGVCHHIWAWIERKDVSLRSRLLLIGGAWLLGGLFYSTTTIEHPIFYRLYADTALQQLLMIRDTDAVGFFLLWIPAVPPLVALFSATLITFALVEAKLGDVGKPLMVLGQISYSTYLLHFPLQLVFAAAGLALGLPKSYFYSAGVQVMFFAALLPLAWASFRYFELPVQRHLRAKLLKRPRRAPSTVPPPLHPVGT